jgi:putative ABC transport system permease protein
MFQNYLRTAFRSIRREGYYAVIKVAGLSLGLGTSLVLLLYVLFQMSFDNFHHDLDRLYRVNQTSIWEPGGGIFHSTGPAVAFALVEEFPEIEGVLRINTPGGYTIRYHRPDGTVAAFNESFSNVFAADSNFFEFFNFELQAGDPAIALRGKNKVVLSDAAAKKLFGDQSPIGKLIEFGEEGVHAADGSEPFSHDHHLVEVTGVTKPQPPNSHFHFDYLLSMYTNPNIKQFEWSWIWTQVATYVKLRPGTDVEAIREKLKTFADRHAPATFKRVGIDYQEFKDEKGGWELYLQPVRDIHLYSAARDGMGAIGNRLGPVGDIREVYVLSLVALFILLIAVINFINLSTARGSTRAKEVGVKKTLGMRRGERGVLQHFAMPRQRLEQRTGGGIPDLGAAVAGGCDHQRTVRAERGAAYTLRVAAERGEHGARLGVPNASGMIARGGDHLRPVGAEVGAGEVGRVTLQHDCRRRALGRCAGVRRRSGRPHDYDTENCCRLQVPADIHWTSLDSARGSPGRTGATACL